MLKKLKQIGQLCKRLIFMFGNVYSSALSISKKDNFLPTIFLTLLVIASIVAAIIYDSYFDESKVYALTIDKTKDDCADIDKEIEYQFEDNDKKLELQIIYLTQIQTSSISWIDRKETNAWAAFSLYLMGLVVLLNFILKKRKFAYCLILVLIIIAISVFVFIHTQYSSIYNTNARAKASKILISRIIDEGKPISNMEDRLKKHYCVELYKGQIFRGKKHALKILKYYIMCNWAESSTEKRILNRINIQEATIYFLIILFNLILFYTAILTKKPKSNK